MAISMHTDTGYVLADGQIGKSTAITFDIDNDITLVQWGTLIELPMEERLPYLYAIMAGEPLNKWENK